MKKVLHETTIGDKSIPKLNLEDYVIPEEKDTGIQDESRGSTVYGIIGAGQCGSKIANIFYNYGYKKCLAINVSSNDLENLDLPKNQKMLLDIGVSGTGKNPEVGTKAIIQYEQEIFRAIQKTFGIVDQIIVVCGAAGGFGSGSIIPLINISKKYIDFAIRDKNGNKINENERVGALIALPTHGESISISVSNNTYKITNELFNISKKKEMTPYIIIDNDKIDSMYGKQLTAKTYWPVINENIVGLFHTFNILSSLNSNYISFDPSDYQNIIRSFGCMIMGIHKITGCSEDEILKAIKNNLTKTLLAGNFDYKTAKKIGCIFVGGTKIMQDIQGLQSKINLGFDVLQEIFANATLYRGIYEDDSNSLRVYVIVGGLDLCYTRINELKISL